MKSWPGRMGQLVLDLFSAIQPTTPSPIHATGADAVFGKEPRPDRPSGTISTTERSRDANDHGLDDVTMIFSSRLKRTWRLERPRGSPSILHLPKSFETAPPEIWEALREWTRAHRKPHPGSKALARRSAQIVFAWMGDGQDRLPGGEAQGRHHDLAPLFERLNREHFQGRLSAIVRWSPRPGGLSTHRTLRLPEGPRHVITIGQLYDHKDVPVHAVEGVLFHEMLHIEHPPKGDGLRRNVHHAAFREAERGFPGYLAWKEWERREAPKLLGRLRREVAKRRRERSR